MKTPVAIMRMLENFLVIFMLLLGLSICRAQSPSTNQVNEASLLVRAEKGDVEAEYQLGMLYSKRGAGTEADVAKSIPWFTKAADHNYPHANLILGQFYGAGQGVKKNEAESIRRNHKAEELYRKAAEKGDVKAQIMLGDMYDSGWGVTVDKKAAITWYTKAAENGNAEAETSLGCLYLSTEEFTNAAKWLKLGAEAGDLKAQNNLGQLYLKGVGLPKDTAEGIKWTRMAAEKGDPTAQSNLGVSYRDGLGVEKDQKKAEEWFAKAKQSYGDK